MSATTRDCGPGQAGCAACASRTASRTSAGVSSMSASTCARFRYRWASCSPVYPMPPWGECREADHLQGGLGAHCAVRAAVLDRLERPDRDVEPGAHPRLLGADGPGAGLGAIAWRV